MIASLVGVLLAAVALAMVLSRPGEAEAVHAESVSYRPRTASRPARPPRATAP
ncbi:hypothetical protein [Streptomyces sudanensis]|uniref:hypothetical protein n=1 Tax=Streptomyces sudanensis TaxID=436397 RepID=UPI0020CE21D7|nr:hypothetical protein [Streptomyces sudanensis]MCP9960072.1 hypothetical protein [Streptomyces sudanensis]